MDRDAALAELIEASARIGADPLLVQGAGGNSSFKCGDWMWVKGSGCWMADAATRRVFCLVSAASFRDGHAHALSELDDNAVDRAASGDLRPSIETALHAIMPQPAVIHAHAVNSVVVSLLANGPELFARAMGADLRGAFIPYVSPGAPLAAAVSDAIARHGPLDVLLLQNHGVVVGAASPRAAAALLREVEARLAFPVRVLARGDAAKAVAMETTRYELLPELGDIASDAFLFAALTSAPLVPDQIVFLGGPVCAVGDGESVDAAAWRTERATGVAPALVLVRDIGAFGRRERTSGARSMIAALAEIARRIPEGQAVCSLPEDVVAALLNWEAERFRQQLDQARK